MSKKTNKKEEIMKNLNLADRIIAALNIGDEGKVNNFLLKVIKDQEREINNREQNAKIEEIEYQNQLEDLQDKLVDAEEDYENAFLDLKINNLKTNQSQKENIPIYLFNIANKREIVESLKNKIKVKKIEAKDYSDLIKLEIKELKSIISKIKS